VTDSVFISNLVQNLRNLDFIYNFAAQSQVAHSFEMPAHTFEVNIKGITNICEAVKSLKKELRPVIFHASTSEMYG